MDFKLYWLAAGFTGLISKDAISPSFAALRRHEHGKQVKRKKKENLSQTFTWTSLETCWTESRTFRFVHLAAVKNTHLGI